MSLAGNPVFAVLRSLMMTYALQVKQRGKPHHCLDAEDPSQSNWLRFVNCCRHEREMNLEAYQFRGSVWYRTIKEIPAHQELLLWYGDEYGVRLGIDPEAFDLPVDHRIFSK